MHRQRRPPVGERFSLGVVVQVDPARLAAPVGVAPHQIGQVARIDPAGQHRTQRVVQRGLLQSLPQHVSRTVIEGRQPFPGSQVFDVKEMRGLVRPLEQRRRNVVDDRQHGEEDQNGDQRDAVAPCRSVVS